MVRGVVDFVSVKNLGLSRIPAKLLVLGKKFSLGKNIYNKVVDNEKIKIT